MSQSALDGNGSLDEDEFRLKVRLLSPFSIVPMLQCLKCVDRLMSTFFLSVPLTLFACFIEEPAQQVSC